MVRTGACPAGIVVIITALVTISSPAVLNAEVVLNEILADPAQDWDGDGEISATDDEWVEIVNRGPSAVDLEGLRLGDAERTWAYGFSGTLATGDRLLVTGSASKAWQQANGESAFGLRLANAGDTVVLWQLGAADTVMVDMYTYQSHEAVDDRASGRAPDGGPVWELYDGLNPYTGGASPSGNGCPPSAGLPNECATPVEEASWGEVKHRYR